MISAGFQVFNRDGSLRVDVTDNLCRVLGTATKSGEGYMDWPYPGVTGTKVVTACSNRTQGDGYFTYAHAYIVESGAQAGRVYFNQGADVQPITLVFIVF